jgi:hypothetical protein
MNNVGALHVKRNSVIASSNESGPLHPALLLIIEYYMAFPDFIVKTYLPKILDKTRARKLLAQSARVIATIWRDRSDRGSLPCSTPL